MDYCENPARSCEHMNFLAFKWHTTEKRTVQFGHENKNSNFHNFLPDLHNNTD